jgi:hypothetical protein
MAADHDDTTIQGNVGGKRKGASRRREGSPWAETAPLVKRLLVSAIDFTTELIRTLGRRFTRLQSLGQVNIAVLPIARALRELKVGWTPRKVSRESRRS